MNTMYEFKNIARSGCAFTVGTGVGVVVATGDDTFFGKIAAATTGTKRPDTILKTELDRFIKIMTVISVSLGVIFLALALGMGYSAQVRGGRCLK